MRFVISVTGGPYHHETGGLCVFSPHGSIKHYHTKQRIFKQACCFNAELRTLFTICFVNSLKYLPELNTWKHKQFHYKSQFSFNYTASNKLHLISLLHNRLC